MRIGVIINPAAGTRNAVRLRRGIEEFCIRSGAELVLRTCERSDRIETLARQLAPEVDMIGVAGGDGSLHGLINGVMTSARPDVPVFFLPAGRGKDAARTLASWDTGQLSRRSLDHRLSTVDLGMVESPFGGRRYFINETSIGIGAFVARSASSLPRLLGTSAYLLGTFHGLVRDRPFSAQLDIEGVGHVEFSRCHHITISNGRYFGGGLQIAPRADARDGLLDIIAVADIGAFEIARALPRLFRATHLEHPKVHHWQATGVSIVTDSPSLIESDGEQWTTTPAHISVRPGALTWVEPT